mgnify:CR=1 FL=1
MENPECSDALLTENGCGGDIFYVAKVYHKVVVFSVIDLYIDVCGFFEDPDPFFVI